MGNAASDTPTDRAVSAAAAAAGTASPGGGGGCPVKHRRPAARDPAAEDTPSTAAAVSRCPVKHSSTPTSSGGGASNTNSGRVGQMYNVYSQPIDPTNNMPANPNQLPHPDQTQPLSTERVRSSIPKGGAADGETWTYPSPQMFFNSLKRKGKGDDAQEQDMETIIAIHNNMNERTWSRVLEFERTFHCDECPEPRLLKFLGRPDDLSMKARIRTWLGAPMPFDRHDWTIDRCGTHVRYIIDYFHDAEQDGDIKPHLRSQTDMKSITVDVRPAPFDSVTSLADVVRMPVYRMLGKVADVYDEPEGGARSKREGNAAASGQDKEDDDGIARPSLDHNEVFYLVQQFREKCRTAAGRLSECDGEEDCGRKKIKLDVCLGKIVCPEVAAAFVKDPGEETFEALGECIDQFSRDATSHS